MRTWCRDCLTVMPESGARPVGEGGPACAACGSNRQIGHAEADSLTIAHIDCDAFFAALEKRERPELADRPVAVGGGERGVVSTACYIARRYGIRSAMPMAEAMKRCPDLVRVKSNFALYEQAARQIRTYLADLTPDVISASIDEAYLNMIGTSRLHGEPAVVSILRVQNRIRAEMGITVSIGLSYARYLAKIASDQDKPDGICIIGRDEAQAKLAPMSVRVLPGVGPKAAGRLHAKGLRTLGDIQSTPLEALRRMLGERAPWYHERANGIGPAWPERQRKSRSVSAETTFNRDLAPGPELLERLEAMAERCAARLRAKGYGGTDITLKLKRADHRIITRHTQIAQPTQRPSRLYEAARALLERQARACPDWRYRLIGVGVANVQPFSGEAADPFTPGDDRTLARETTLISLRDKFGADAVVSGRNFQYRQDKRSGDETP